MEARLEAEHVKEMNVLTNEAENGFMKDKFCETAIGFDDWKAAADFSDSNFAWVEGPETDLSIESEEMIKWNGINSVFWKNLHEKIREVYRNDYKIWNEDKVVLLLFF